MRPDEFWKMTPRKFFALVELHGKLNSVDEHGKEQEKNNIQPMTMGELMKMR